MTIAQWLSSAMTIALAYTLLLEAPAMASSLLEAPAMASSFAILWLSFWLRDRHRQHHDPAADFASDQQDGANVGPLVLASTVSGTGLTIDLASSDVQPASEKDEAILNRPEYAQHLYDKPQIQPEQRQRA